jgi:hypothetical protein
LTKTGSVLYNIDTKNKLEGSLILNTPQSIVHENCRSRGYVNSWSYGAFLVRNVFKIIEEVWELYGTILVNKPTSIILTNIDFHLREAAIRAETQFIAAIKNQTPDINPVNMDDVKKELADVQVVVFNIAAALSELSGSYFDVVQAAVDKSESDIKRGIKNESTVA